VHVRFGHVQNPFSAPVLAAIERGYLADAGVEFELTRFANGSAMSRALALGEVDAGVGGHLQTLAATLAGADQVFIAPLGFERAPDHLPIALVAAGGISSGRELEGAIVGVSALAAISELQLRIYMRAQGADHATLTLRAMPFAELAAALQSGEIAAASAPDPFAARLAADGLAQIIDRGSLSAELADGQRVMIAGLAASRAWVQGNAGAARAIAGALARAIDELRGDPSPAGLHVPHFDRRLREADLQPVFDLAYEHALVDRRAQANELIVALD
jgi:ABC-type nitrate/sulfonate/bicarbonate transport system substrate-binding protein